jgi:hypothetical protein
MDIVYIISQLLLFGLFIWFLTKRDQEWRDFLKEDRQESRSMFGKVVDALESMKRQIVNNTVSILIHDATCRGKDPSALGTQEELVQKYLDQT